MSRRKDVTSELLIRIEKVEKLISTWMREKYKSETTPEDCIAMLVEQGVYNYDSKGKAHYFRKDLRTLRDCGKLDVLKHIKVEQRESGSRWYISL